MLKWKFKQLLVQFAILILALAIAAISYKVFFTPVPIEPIQIINAETLPTSSEFIISKEFILGKLQFKSQIVSMEQELKNISFTHVDDSLFGQRHTELTLNGTYKMGLDTSGIEVTHIDKSGIVYIDLPDPKLISLELPYDQIDIEKTKGWARLAMNEEELKNFYKAAETSIRNDILHNEQTLKQAELFNQEAVRGLIKKIPTVKSVVFQ